MNVFKTNLLNLKNFNHKPTYLEFPILQITYIIFWIPLGFFLSYFFTLFTINTVTQITMFLLDKWYFSFQYYLMSGRFGMEIRPFYLLTNIIYDFLILCIGLELISKFLYKKRLEYEENIDDEQDACDIQKSD